MLQFTDRETGEQISVNPQQVSAIVPLKQRDGIGCVLLMVGGFELHVQEGLEDVSAKVQKRLSAY